MALYSRVIRELRFFVLAADLEPGDWFRFEDETRWREVKQPVSRAVWSSDWCEIVTGGDQDNPEIVFFIPRNQRVEYMTAATDNRGDA